MANRGDTLKRGGLRGREELVEKGGSPGNIAKIKFIPSLQGRSLQGKLSRPGWENIVWRQSKQDWQYLA